MRRAKYRRMERAIAANDKASMTERWRYGRQLLEDDTATTPAGHLRNGVLKELLAVAAEDGIELNEREISYRLKAGRAYKTEAEFRTARAEYSDWSTLREKSFPPVQVPLDADLEPYDPRDTAERIRDAKRKLARGLPEEADEQLALFEHYPADQFDRYATLADLAKWTEESAEWTARHARKDAERAEYLGKLIRAVSGDMSKTWEEANAALEASGGEA